MSEDLRKLKDEAAHAAERGRWKKAGELYDRVLRRDRDPQWSQRSGDAWRRAGDKTQAVARYVFAAEGYARGGFLLKAIAVCKLILDIDPRHVETQERLATLYARDRHADSATVPIDDGAPAAATSDSDGGGDGRGAPGITLSEEDLDGGADASDAPHASPASVTARSIGLAEDQRSTPVEVAAVAPAARSSSSDVAAPALAPRAHRVHHDLDGAGPAASLRAAAAAAAAALGEDDSAGHAAAAHDEGAPDWMAPPLSVDLAEPPPTDGDVAEDAASAAAAAAPHAPAHAHPPAPRVLGRITTRSVPLDSLKLNAVHPRARISELFPAVEVPLEDDDIPVHLDDDAPGLPTIPLFSSLDKDRLQQLIERVDRIDAPAGTVVVRQGDTGDSLYVIVRGSVNITVDTDGVGHTIGRLEEGSFFGELALITRARRLATVTAEVDSELLAISSEVIADLMHEAPDVLTILLRFFRDRLIARLVMSSPLFQSFPGDEGTALAARFQFLELEPGAHLVDEGARAPGLFVVLAGGCDVVHRGDDGAEEPLAVVGPGDVVGEMSLLQQVPSMATVRARTRVWALAMPRATFQEVIMTHPQVLIYVSELADRRRDWQALPAPVERPSVPPPSTRS